MGITRWGMAAVVAVALAGCTQAETDAPAFSVAPEGAGPTSDLDPWDYIDMRLTFNALTEDEQAALCESWRDDIDAGYAEVTAERPDISRDSFEMIVWVGCGINPDEL